MSLLKLIKQYMQANDSEKNSIYKIYNKQY